MRTPKRSLRVVTGNETTMPLMGHLVELRRRLIVSIVAVTVCAVGGFFLWDRVLEVTTKPYCDAQAARGVGNVLAGSSCQLVITSPLELLTTRLTIAGYLGLVAASPIVLWQLWRFVTPALERGEKRYAIPFVSASTILFLTGAALAWITFPKAMSFFLAVGGSHVVTLFNPAPYLKLIFLMMAAFGLVFELPVLLVFLQIAGMSSSRKLRDWRRFAIVGNFATAAVITPSGDPYSLFLMAIPMCVFYEAAILIGRVLKK